MNKTSTNNKFSKLLLVSMLSIIALFLSFIAFSNFQALAQDEQDNYQIYDVNNDGSLTYAELDITGSKTQLFTTDMTGLKQKYQNALATGNSFVVALDPGHGGGDPGACCGSVREADCNWRIAMACKAELEQYTGVSVYVTRGAGECPGLEERVIRAQNSGAQVFVSLHCNSGGGTGAEVWVQHSGGYLSDLCNGTGYDIGSRILNKICSALGLPNRGLKERYCTDGSTYPDGSQGDYYTVLFCSRERGIPGMIVEHAFVDGDNGLLSNMGNCDTMGVLDAQAIAEHYGFTKSAPPKPYVYKTEPGKITLAWDAIEGAEKYAIAKYENGSYTLIDTNIHDTKYTLSNLQEGQSYQYLVQAYVNGRWSSNDTKYLFSTKMIPCPTNVKTYDAGDGQIKLTWDAMSGATKYAVAEHVGNDFILHTVDCNETTYTVTNLENEADHEFLVQGLYQGTTWSIYGPGNYVVGRCSGPTKPYNIQTSSTSSTITLQWAAVSGAKGYAVSVKKSDGQYDIKTYNNPSTSYTITNLEPYTTYNILVQTNFGNHYSKYVDPDDLVSCKTKWDPTHPVVTTQTGDGFVKLSWDKIDEAEKYAVSVKQGNDWHIYTTDCTDLTYTVSNLINGKTYTFLVQSYVNGAWNRYNESDYVKATPSGHIKPYDITAYSNTNSIELHWGSVSGATKYAVSIRNNDGTYNILNTDIRDTKFAVVGLNKNTEYEFLVQANLNGSWSRYEESDHVKFSTKDLNLNANATATNEGEVTVTWNQIEGATQYACSEYLGNNNYDIHILPATETSYIAGDLVCQREHKFLVQAYVAGMWNTYSVSDLKGATPTGEIKPYEITGTSGAKSIELNWHKVYGAKKYAVSIRYGENNYDIRTTDCTDTSYIVNNLKECTDYTFLVQAYIDNNWSRYNEEDHVQFSTINTKPQASAAATGEGEITISWNAIQGATQYACSEYLGGNNFDIHILPANTNSYVASDLVCQKEHKFLVQAYVAGSWSPYTESDFVGATATGAIKPTVSSHTAGYNSVTLNWNKVSGAKNYAVSVQNNDGSYDIRTTSCNELTYKVGNIKGGNTYKFLVQAYLDGAWSRYTDTDLYSATPLVDPTRPVPTVVSTEPGIVNLAWEAIDGATKYAVSTKNADGSYNIRTTSCTATNYQLAGLSAGHYAILVQAFVNNQWSRYDDCDLVHADVVAPQGNTIMSAPRSAAAQMARYYCAKVGADTYPAYYRNNPQLGATSIEAFAQICYEEGVDEGVDPAVMFCQMIHETGWLRFGGSVKVEQCNFGGLGATSATTGGAWFPDIRTGIRAQIQHLKAYGCTSPLNKECVDPRFNFVTRGCAPLVTDLNGKWAVPGVGYGESILRLMDEMYNY